MVDFGWPKQEWRMTLLPEQCRAPRGLLDWTQEQLARLAGVSRSAVRDFECGRHALYRATEALLIKPFEAAGVRLVSDRRELGISLRRSGRAAPNTSRYRSARSLVRRPAARTSLPVRGTRA